MAIGLGDRLTLGVPEGPAQQRRPLADGDGVSGENRPSPVPLTIPRSARQVTLSYSDVSAGTSEKPDAASAGAASVSASNAASKLARIAWKRVYIIDFSFSSYFLG